MSHPVDRIVGVPRVPREHLPRPRLVRRLDGGAPLTVVRARGGSGKTSLLAEWAREQVGCPGVWVTLTPDDRLRPDLWSAVATAVEDAGLAADAPVMRTVPHVVETGADLRRLVVRAFRQLGPFVLVLDEYQHVADEEAHEDLLALARECADLRVLLATRVRSPLEHPAVTLVVDRVVVAGDELLLTAEETAGLLARGEGGSVVDVPARTVQAVHDLSAGHPLVVRALLMEARTAGRDLPDVAGPGRLGGDLVREALGRTLRSPLDAALARFLLRTAVPDVVTEELARSLSGDDATPAHLERLEALGVATWQDGRPPAVRYHPLVLRLLREEARRRIPEELPALHARTARAALEAGHAMPALRHAVASGDADLASRVAMLRWWDLVPHGADVRALLLGMPRAELRHHPFLAGMLALLLNADRGERVRALQYFTLALWGVRYRRPRATTEERLLLDVLESTALRLTGSARGLARTRAAAELLEEPGDRLAALASQLRRLRTQTAVSLFRLGRPEEALRVLDGALALEPGESEHLLHHALALRAGVLAHVGAMGAAAETLRRADALDWPEGARDDYLGALYHYAAAWAAIERLDGERAQVHLDAMAPHLPTLEYQPYFAVVQAFAGALRGRAEEEVLRLTEHVERERSHRRAMPGERAMVDMALAVLHHLAGRGGAAYRLFEQVGAPTAGSQSLVGAVDLAAGRPEEAVARLALSRSTGEVAPRVEVTLALVLAAASLRLGDERTALDAAARMAAGMAHHGLRAHLVLVPRSDLLAVHALLARHRPDLVGALGTLTEVPEVLRVAGAVLPLTEREAVVLRELPATASVAEIAAQLGVSANTVKSQLRSIYKKLGVRSRDEALAVALREDLLGRR
jgi:LuxR family maltose regulon positive regulatory protein